MTVPPRGVEQSAKTPEKPGSGDKSGANSGAVDTGKADGRQATDPELQTIVEAWPTLPAAVKAGILAMVKATK